MVKTIKIKHAFIKILGRPVNYAISSFPYASEARATEHLHNILVCGTIYNKVYRIELKYSPE